MDPKRRRPVMMVIILVTGTLLIMLNLPLIIVILGTLLAGAVGLLVTGSISISREKPEKAEKEGKRKEKKEKKPKEKAKKGDKGLFSGLKGALKRDRKGISPASKEEEIKKIDEMLAHAIEGEGPEAVSVAAATDKAAAGITGKKTAPEPEISSEDEDLLLALSEEDFGEDIFDEIKVGEEDDGFPSMDEDELDKQLLIGGAESVDDILAAHAAELEEEEGELPDITGEGGLENISGLDSLDLDEEALLAASLDDLDLEEEEEPEEVYSPGEVFEEEEEPEELEEMEEAVSGDLEMISFASGVEDDEMISELKSQKKKKKQEVDLSLVRELRDVKIDVNELEEEMEEVLGFLDKKKEGS